jgi:carbonic anhydrase/acetyltransferase-like protein (isoleucine patch superfamily)
LGRHYELVSVLYRLLGAKVGKRVFWPGHLPIFTGEFDLLEIGDDVVFGSRTAILCTTVDSCDKVIFCAGSNFSDNSLALPGSIIGKNVVLGSNSICPEGWYLPEGSVWVGNEKCEPVMLERGSEEVGMKLPILSSTVAKSQFLQMVGDMTTLRPFGMAFYKEDANYFVFPLCFIIGFTICCKVLALCVHTFPILSALHGAAAICYGWNTEQRDYHTKTVSTSTIFFTVLLVFIVTNLIGIIIWLSIEISSKWVLMGRRRPGQYDYNTSDYCQRWELYQIVGKMRSMGRVNLLSFIAGTPYMNILMRLQGAKIGSNCCLYPTGGDPYMPEPDLVDMGNNVVLDKASVVCHLNTGGHFVLEKIVLEDNVTLRSRSRVQQGVVMEKGSMILEKSLVLTGEVLDQYSCWSGLPATRVLEYSTSQFSSPLSSSSSSPLFPDYVV